MLGASVEPAAALRWLLDRHRPETEAALGIVRTMTSSLDVRAVLRESVHLAAAVARCQGAVIYILDEGEQRLWIQAASSGYEQWIDRFSLELGEGLTGWTALNRRPAMISEHPQDDPRYLTVPELNDLEFQSALTYPMISPSDRLVGVITLHTEAPRDFTSEDLILVAPIASLAAAAVERAQLYTQSERQVEIFRAVGDVGDALASPAASRRALRTLCESTRMLLEGELVALYVREPGRWRLASSVSREVHLPQQELEPGLADAFAEGIGPQELASSKHGVLFDAVSGGGTDAGAGVAVPLNAGGETVGLLICLVRRRVAASTASDLLGMITNVAALVIQGNSLVERLAARDVESVFLDALSEGREPAGVVAARARIVGVDLANPHAAVFIQIVDSTGGGDPERALEGLVVHLKDIFPGSVTASRGLRLSALIRADGPIDGLKEGVRDAVATAHAESGAEFAAGISATVRRLHEYRRAFADAQDAMQIGLAIHGPGQVLTYDELGAQRHLWALARTSARDRSQERIETLLAYDDSGNRLLETLEVFLLEHGNRERASKRLGIHRNTLRQRVERIREVSEIDLDDEDSHFDLAIALGIVRFRRLQIDPDNGTVQGE